MNKPAFEDTVPVGSSSGGVKPAFEDTLPAGNGQLTDDYWGGVKDSAKQALQQLPGALEHTAQQAGTIGRAMFGGFPESGIQMAQGTPLKQTPVGQALDTGVDMAKGAAQGIWQGIKDTGSGIKSIVQRYQGTPWRSTEIGQKFQERPFSVPLGIASTVVPAFEATRAALPLAARGAEVGAMTAGRRALGFTKRFLNTEGKEANANAATRTALDEGVIKPFETPDSMMKSAQELQTASGEKMGSIFNEQNRGAKGALSARAKPQLREQFLFDQSQAIADLDNLRPKAKSGLILQGGDYTAQNEVIDHAIETIRAHGDRPLPWDEANDLKAHLQGLATYDQAKSTTVNSLKKSLGGVFKDSMDRQLAETTEEMGGDASIFGKAKKNWKAGHDMRAALQNKISSQEGNNVLSLGDMAAGALGGIVGGHFGTEGSTLGALGSMAARKAASKYGASTSASALNKLSDALKGASKAVGPVSGETAAIAVTPTAVSKLLDEPKAREYLKRSKGDKIKARQMAKDDGYKL